MTELSAEPRVLGQLLENKAKKLKDRVYLYFDDQKITYEQLNERANRVANGFLKLGIKKGDKVCVMLPNRPEFLYAIFGIFKTGAIMVPLNNYLRGDSLSYVVNHSDAETYLIDPEFLSSYEFVREQLTNIKNLVVDTTEAPAGFNLPKGSIAFHELLKESSDPPAVDLKLSDTATILYTSGTTGLPKGAMLPHNVYFIYGNHTKGLGDYTAEDVFYTGLPLFHGNAQMASMMPALLCEGKLALVRKFSATHHWDEIRKYNATTFAYLGTLIHMLYNQPKKDNDADNPARIALGGGAPREIWREFEKRFSLKLVEGFGMTEGCLLQNKTGEKIGSIGKPAPVNEVKIFNENDEEVPPNVVGELVSRPNQPYAMMTGYYKDPLKTLDVCRNLWFHTGDLARKDEEGFFYFVDRKKDYLRRRGENISSFQVESIICKHPAVMTCAVVGVPSEVGEDEVMAYIELRPGEKLTPEELLDFCSERMAYFMLPRYVEFVKEFAKTATSKIEKYKLKKEITETTWDSKKAGYKVKR